MPDDLHLLLCYDGSDQAAEAIDFAAALFPRGSRATVLYVWELTAVAAVGGAVPMALPPDVAHEDEARARRLAEAGAQRARRLGLAAQARTEESTAGAWRTIVDVADGDVDLIVMGTRGLSGLKELLLGSVSHHVAQHAACPVLIAPGAELGQARREAEREDAKVSTGRAA
jgi:nucleotide-binding universal stress UspA family protein